MRCIMLYANCAMQSCIAHSRKRITMSQKLASKHSVRFCNKVLSFDNAHVIAQLSKVKDDDISNVKRYYVVDNRKRKHNVSDVMKHCANIELVWRKGRTGNLVGTYSTAQAMRVLVRLRVKVYDAHNENKIIKLSDIVSDKKA